MAHTSPLQFGCLFSPKVILFNESNIRFVMFKVCQNLPPLGCCDTKNSLFAHVYYTGNCINFSQYLSLLEIYVKIKLNASELNTLEHLKQ